MIGRSVKCRSFSGNPHDSLSCSAAVSGSPPYEERWPHLETCQKRSVVPEDFVRPSQALIDSYAERIERAYRLRRPDWRRDCSSNRVWSAAAAVLLSVDQSDTSIPHDPELFVASQPMRSYYADPWVEIATPAAAQLYRSRVAEIVRVLRRELRAEVRYAESQVASGRRIANVLAIPSRRVSPLGCYIVAHRASRPILAKRFVDAAVAQHGSCPLYRQASLKFLPAELYPVPEPSEITHFDVLTRQSRQQVLLN